MAARKKAATSKLKKGASQAKGKAKGAWANGKSKAQGGTPKRISRPVDGVKKFGGSVKKGANTAIKKGSARTGVARKGKK